MLRFECVARAARVRFLFLTALILLGLWWAHDLTGLTVRTATLACIASTNVLELTSAVFIYSATKSHFLALIFFRIGPVVLVACGVLNVAFPADPIQVR